MDYENVLRKIGDFGPYQLLIFFILAITALQTGMDLEFIVFMSYTPQFNCTDPAFVNATLHSNMSFDSIDQCKITIPTEFNTSETLFCTEWIYDQSQMKETFVTEFNLICGKERFKTYAEMLYFAGVTVGMILGSAGDYIGRRKIIILCAVWEAFTMILTPLMPTVESILLFRFVRGFAISIYYQGLALVSEIIPMERRALYGNNFWFLWATGYMSIAGIAFLSPYWRQMKLFSCIPLVIYILFFFVIPESPRWLALKGRTNEAIKVLKLIAKRNRKPFPPGFFDNFISPKEPTGRFQELFKTQPMRLKTLLCWYTQSSISMCYFGLSITSGFASENIFLNVFLLGLIELPCGILGWITCDKLGRRLPSAVAMIMTSACVIAVPFLPDGWVRIVVAVFGKCLLTTGYCTFDIFLTEIFPTSIRNVGLFSTGTCASFATILAPKINDLSSSLYCLPNIVFAIVSFVCGVLVWTLLPETNHCPMAQTVEEADGLIRGKEKEWTREMSKKFNFESVRFLDSIEEFEVL